MRRGRHGLREPFFPRLTTMQIDRPLMSSIAWDLLLNRLITETGKPKVIKTKMQLIDRGSCAAPRDFSLSGL